MVRGMSQTQPLTLAIVGRPNVGKSTLFNRLAGRQLAIVHDRPGVTRDWREAQGSLFGLPLRLIDTAGLEDAAPETLSGRMRARTVEVLDDADAVLFVVDGRAGILPADEHFAAWLRRRGRPVFLIVNKAENERAVATAMAEGHALGLGAPLALSAAHGTGLEDLYEALAQQFPGFFAEEDSEDAEDPALSEDDATLDDLEGVEDFDFTTREAPEEDDSPIRIALVGRPNVGKSTLLNAILKEERVVTSPEAGTTRDAIAVDRVIDGTRFRLVDTAGLRKSARIADPLEKMAIADTMRAIRLARIVVLVVDATRPLEKQDLVIAGHVADEGRAMILVLNKWDLVEKRKETLEGVRDQLTRFSQVPDLRIVTLSALTGNNIDGLWKAARAVYESWNARVTTGALNRWLAMRTQRHPPPLVDGRPNRLRYITQIKRRPPTFALWASRPDALPDTYIRYLVNSLREDHEIPGVPLRLALRKSKNPFTE